MTSPPGHAHLMPSDFVEALGLRLGMPHWYLRGTDLPAGTPFPTLISVGQYLAIVGNVIDAGHRADFVDAAIRGIGQIHLTGVTLALQSAPTLGDGLALLVEFGSDRTGLHRFALRRSHAGSFLEIGDNTDLGRCSAVLAETVVIAGYHYFAAMVPTLATQILVHLSGTAADHAPDLARQLGGQLVFGQPQNGIAFPSGALSMPNTAHDAALWDIGQRRCILEAKQLRDTSQAKRIKTRIARSMIESKLMPRLTDIAKIEKVSSRTLIRQMRAGGHSYHDIVDSVRRELAADMLARGSSVGAISEALCFADPSSFRRSYRRWFGINPSAGGKSATP